MVFSAHESELHPDLWWCDLAVGDFVLKSGGYVAEFSCLGPGAWHPLDPSWVPLPVPGAGKVYWEHGVRGLASPDPPSPSLPPGCHPVVCQHHRSGKSGGHSACANSGEQIVVYQCHRSWNSCRRFSLRDGGAAGAIPAVVDVSLIMQ